MEVGLREWLIVGAIIVIVLIVVDGWRRMRAQSNTLKIDIDDKLSELGDETFNPELPLGSARIFKPKDEQHPPASSARPITEDVESVNNVEVLESAPIQENTADERKLQTSANSEFIDSNESVAKDNKGRVEPVFEEDIPSDLVPYPLKNFQKIAEEISQDLNPPNSDSHSLNNFQETSVAPAEVEKTTFEEETAFAAENLSPPRVPDSFSAKAPIYSELGDSELGDFDVPDILKKDNAGEHRPTERQADVDDSIIENQSQPDAVAESGITGDIEQVSAIDPGSLSPTEKENTDEIVSNLLHNLSKSKQTTSAESEVIAESTSDEYVSVVTNADEATLDTSNSDSALVVRDNVFTTDKFEQLLAEQSQDTANDEQGLVTVADDQSSQSVKIQEIEALKARLKELSVDEIDDLVNDSELNDGPESIAQPSDEIIAAEMPTQTPVQAPIQVPVQVTTVIDDEVDLENLGIGSNRFPVQIDIIDPQPQTDDSDALAVLLNGIDEQAAAEGTSAQEIPENLAQETQAREKVTLEAIEQTENSAINLGISANAANSVIDTALESHELADPLMDGYVDQDSSQALIESFEQDLAADQQAVSNELDMPITEILKKQQTKQSPSAIDTNAQQQYESQMLEESLLDDPLLAVNQLSDSLLSGADFDENGMLESRSEERQQEALENDKLGFTAFEQDPTTDPLMNDYQEPIATPDSAKQQKIKHELNQLQQKSFFDEPDTTLVVEKEPVVDNTPVAVPEKKPRKVINNVDDPNAVLIVTVVAKDQYLNGSALKHVVQACGMEFGDMDVFHRFEDGADQGAVQFSMANAINPGTFDIHSMDETATPGVSFFMSMDEPQDPKKALECMLATAETVALHLHGDLLDDDRSVLRPQTKEHYKERIRIHEMNKLTRRAQ